MSECCLEMKGICKNFGSLKALDDASLRVKQGEVRALLGINGAGKSTLIKVLSGVYAKDEGDIYIEGKKVDINSPEDAIKYGISTVYQDPQMVESFSGYENIYLGSETEKNGLFGKMSRKELLKRGKKLLETYPLEIDLEKPVYLLSMIEREIIAVLRALSKNCKILILDEPTSILTDKEKHILFDVVRTLKKRGVSIIYITHHLDEVEKICDGFTVFRNGKQVAEKDIINGKVDSSYIAELMLGQKLEKLYPEKTKGKEIIPYFKVENLALEGKFQSVDFEANKGEIYGIFGLVGSGIDEISKIIFGAMKKTEGKVYKEGKEIDIKNPKKVIDAGIFLVPGDRKKEGQIGDMSIVHNMSIAKMSRVSNGIKLIHRKEEVKIAKEMQEKLSIATTTIHKKVAQLSGGNQQKVVISKGLFTEGDVYIFTEPTVGVDVGAKFAIYSIMRELAKKAAVLIISSDPEEVLGNADKIMVLHKGCITMEKKAENTNLKEMLVHAVSNPNEERSGEKI